MTEVRAGNKRVVLVAAVAQNRVIGRDAEIPWHLPEDFAHFKIATVGHTLLMGRATFESIGRPLPGRHTIVLTRDEFWHHEGVSVAHDLQDAIDLADDDGLPGDLIVAGGSHLYAAALPIAHMQVISEVHQAPDGNVFYPDWDRSDWLKTSVEAHSGFDVVQWLRRPHHARACDYDFALRAADHWWDADCSLRLRQALTAQQGATSEVVAVNWSAVYETAMRVISEAAMDGSKKLNPDKRRWHRVTERRRVRVEKRLSEEDTRAVQGTLFHWSDFVASSCCSAQ